MSSKLNLNCVILGDSAQNVFDVTIGASAKVSALKEAIRDRNKNQLHGIDDKSLELFKVAIPVDEHFDHKIEEWKKSNQQPLRPVQTLGSLFQGLDPEKDETLRIVVIPPLILQLHCYMLGDELGHISRVGINASKNVYDLKRLIKAEYSLETLAKDLDLWAVSFPMDSFGPKARGALGPSLNIYKVLSDVFSNPPDMSCVHIIASIPRIESIRTPYPPHSSKFPVVDAHNLAVARGEFCRKRTKQPPSAGAKPQSFINDQRGRVAIPCGRPDEGPKSLSVTLLHPVFGEFIDNCSERTPTLQDHKFVWDFVEVMSAVYSNQQARQKRVLEVFNNNGIAMKQSRIDGYETDGDISVGAHRYLIAGLKNEIGSTGAEPYFQGTLYYLESTRDQAQRNLESVLPCLVLLLFGPYIAIAGAAWTDCPNIEMLSTAIPCHFHYTNSRLRNMPARQLGALREALRSLETYYKKLHPFQNQTTPVTQPNPTVPYRSYFLSQDTSKNWFEYHSRSGYPHLIYFGTLRDTNDQRAICIKFTRCYGKEAHEFCASKGFAPKLRAVERLPGGWYMVVMDDISEDYVELYKHPSRTDNDAALASCLMDLREHLVQFHEAGFVHGGVHDTNIMAKKSGFDGSLQLLDFDWSGRCGEVVYPFDLNATSVRRPGGATGGGPIASRHDIEMLDYISNE